MEEIFYVLRYPEKPPVEHINSARQYVALDDSKPYGVDRLIQAHFFLTKELALQYRVKNKWLDLCQVRMYKSVLDE